MSISRRQMITGVVAGVGGVAVGVAGATLAEAGQSERAATAHDASPAGSQSEPFYGAHQSGVATPAQAYAAFAAYDLRPGSDRDAVARLMRLLSDDAARLTQGTPALGDTEPELALAPSRLTVTFGFGPRLFDAVGLPAQRPPSLRGLPAYSIDRLQSRWSGGDLLVQVCADDSMSVSHAQRMLWKDIRAFGTPAWLQRGFLAARGSAAPGSTGRNLMGQVDGTVNPRTNEEFDGLVWSDGPPGWFAGGTLAVIRRIRMDLDRWDRVDRADREGVIGRTLDTGAPLTGSHESDPGDLSAVDAHGMPVIPEYAHIRRARVAGRPGAPFLRRGYNYDEGEGSDGVTDAGLIFAAYAADLDAQFLPVQQSLAHLDLLNQWTTPIGSAVFALPPGAQPGGWVGQSLLG